MHLPSRALTDTHTHTSTHTYSHGSEHAQQIHTPVEPVADNLLGYHTEAERVLDFCVPRSPGARKQPYATSMGARGTEADVSTPVGRAHMHVRCHKSSSTLKHSAWASIRVCSCTLDLMCLL